MGSPITIPANDVAVSFSSLDDAGDLTVCSAQCNQRSFTVGVIEAFVASSLTCLQLQLKPRRILAIRNGVGWTINSTQPFVLAGVPLVKKKEFASPVLKDVC